MIGPYLLRKKCGGGNFFAATSPGAAGVKRHPLRVDSRRGPAIRVRSRRRSVSVGVEAVAEEDVRPLGYRPVVRLPAVQLLRALPEARGEQRAGERQADLVNVGVAQVRVDGEREVLRRYPVLNPPPVRVIDDPSSPVQFPSY